VDLGHIGIALNLDNYGGGGGITITIRNRVGEHVGVCLAVGHVYICIQLVGVCTVTFEGQNAIPAGDLAANMTGNS